jgi:AmiR/NasT family two-component response regulator
MIQPKLSPRTFVIEDWRPVSERLEELLGQMGHRVEVLPNVLELVRKRVLRDRPDLIVVNASTLLIGEHAPWRRLLGGETAAVVVAPTGASGWFFEQARTLGVSGLVEEPLSREKLALAIDLALRNQRVARRLRSEIRRLEAMRARLEARTGDRWAGSVVERVDAATLRTGGVAAQDARSAPSVGASRQEATMARDAAELLRVTIAGDEADDSSV